MMYKVALIAAVTGMVKTHVITRRPIIFLLIIPSFLANAVPISAPIPTIEVETGRP